DDANTFHRADAGSEGNRRRPAIEKTARQWITPSMRPCPVRIAPEQSLEVREDRIAAAHAARPGRIRIEGVSCIERDKPLRIVTCPCREPACTERSGLCCRVAFEIHRQITIKTQDRAVSTAMMRPASCACRGLARVVRSAEPNSAHSRIDGSPIRKNAATSIPTEDQ